MKRVDQVAKTRGVSRAQVVRELVAESISSQETVAAAFMNPVLMQALGQVMTTPGIAGEVLRTMKQELSQDQLQLFEATLDRAVGELSRVPAAKSRAPRPDPAKRPGKGARK